MIIRNMYIVFSEKSGYFCKINVKEKGKVYDNTAKMQSTNQLGV